MATRPLMVLEEALAALQMVGASEKLRTDFAERIQRILDARCTASDAESRVETASGYGHHTKRGHVILQIDMVEYKWSVAEARRIAGMLQEAAEAAVSDEIVMTLLRDRFGLDASKLGLVLLDLRQIRQGTRGTLERT